MKCQIWNYNPPDPRFVRLVKGVISFYRNHRPILFYTQILSYLNVTILQKSHVSLTSALLFFPRWNNIKCPFAFNKSRRGAGLKRSAPKQHSQHCVNTFTASLSRQFFIPTVGFRWCRLNVCIHVLFSDRVVFSDNTVIFIILHFKYFIGFKMLLGNNFNPRQARCAFKLFYTR